MLAVFTLANGQNYGTYGGEMTFFFPVRNPIFSLALIIKAKGKCRQLNHARLLNRYEKGTVKFVSRTEFMTKLKLLYGYSITFRLKMY